MHTKRHTTTLPLVAALALVALAPALRADEADADKNEIVVFGGISLLDAGRTTSGQFDGTRIELPAMGRFGRFGRPPVAIPPTSFEAETRIGSSAVFGARYSRQIKDRLALEGDLSVAPSHALELGGRGCVGDVCVGTGDGDGRFGRGPRLGERNVTAWHYGAGLAYEITGGDVRPFVLLGAGGVTWDGTGDSETNFALRFGGGLKVLFGRVGARIDVIDHLVLDHLVSGDSEHDVHVTAGLLVRF